MPIQTIPKIDHFKFLVDPAQARLVEHGTELKMKVQRHHSTNNTCPNFVKDISPLEYHQQKKNIQANKKTCSLLETQHKKVQPISARTIRVDFLLRNISRQTSPS